MNLIKLSGTVYSQPEFLYENRIDGSRFYKFYTSTQRKSGCLDVVPCVVSEGMVEEFSFGSKVSLHGEIRTRAVRVAEDRSKLDLYVFVRSTGLYYQDENKVALLGHVTREALVRTTPYGREISDTMIASNRADSSGRSDYIPCIAWNKNAYAMSYLQPGQQVTISGRLQSRVYFKKHDNGSTEEKVTYEISIKHLERITQKEGDSGENQRIAFAELL